MRRNDKQLRRLFSTLFTAAILGIACLYSLGSALADKSIDPVAAACLTACLFAFTVVEELVNSEEDKIERRIEHDEIVRDIQMFDQSGGSQE